MTHHHIPQLSHLTRSFELPVHVPLDRGAKRIYNDKNGGDDREEDDILESMAIDDNELRDEAEADTQRTCAPTASVRSLEVPSAILRVTHLITHSATWRVPVLYVGISRTDGQLCNELAYDETVLFGSDTSTEDKSKSPNSSGAPEEVASTGIFRRGSSPASALVSRRSPTIIDETSLQLQSTAGGDNDNHNHHNNDDGYDPDPPASTQMAYFPPIAPCEWPLPPTRASQSAMPAGAGLRRGDEGEDGQPQVAWSLHPCQTSVVVGEMLEVGSQREGAAGYGSVSKGEDDTGWSRRYIGCFVAICASAVEMRV